MTKEEFIKERTRIISEMLDNPDDYGIYPTTKCFEQLDELFDKITANRSENPDNLIEIVPDWIVKYDAANYQSSAGRAVRILMEIINRFRA